VIPSLRTENFCCHNHHHHHQGLAPLIRSISRVTTALANVSSVFQLFSFLVVCSDMILKGFGLVAFFASVKASSVCIHLSCPVCIQSVVHGIRSRLFCGHKGCSLPEVSITSFLPLQFFVSVRLSESNFGSPEVSYHETYSARDWLSILRTPHSTQYLQKKHRTDFQIIRTISFIWSRNLLLFVKSQGSLPY